MLFAFAPLRLATFLVLSFCQSLLVPVTFTLLSIVILSDSFGRAQALPVDCSPGMWLIGLPKFACGLIVMPYFCYLNSKVVVVS